MSNRFNITLDSSAELTDLCSQIELLTYAAELIPAHLSIDESKNEIVIPMTRKNMGRKRRFFWGTQPFLLSATTFQSQLIIRDYASYTISNLTDEYQIPDICILFGVQVKENELYFCSVEEIHGPPAFEMTIILKSYNIEFHDIA